MPNRSSEVDIIKSAFEFFDKDKSGHIDIHELSYSMQKLGYELSFNEVSEILKRFDSDQNGQISLDEFIEFIECL